MTIGAVTGLAAEAKCAQALGLIAVAGGGDAAATERAIAQLLTQGVRGLVSFGIAGALAPELDCGTLVIARAIKAGDGEVYRTDIEWQRRLVAQARASNIPEAVGDILGRTAIAYSALEKRRLYRASGAIAVDLESHLVARAAQRAGLPFAAVRAIADPAGLDLPPAAVVPLTTSGEPRIAKVLASVCRNPGQIPALIALAQQTHKALDTLKRLGPM